MRYIVWILFGFTVGYSVASAIVNVFSCDPVEASWRIEYATTARCINRGHFYYTQAALGILTDIATVVTPLPMLKTLRLPMRQKVGAGLVLTVGAFVCIISIVRFKTLFDLADDDNLTRELSPFNFFFLLFFSLEFLSQFDIHCCLFYFIFLGHGKKRGSQKKGSSQTTPTPNSSLLIAQTPQSRRYKTRPATVRARTQLFHHRRQLPHPATLQPEHLPPPARRVRQRLWMVEQILRPEREDVGGDEAGSQGARLRRRGEPLESRVWFWQRRGVRQPRHRGKQPPWGSRRPRQRRANPHGG